MAGGAGAGAAMHGGGGGDGKEQNRRLSLDGDLPAEAVGPLEGATTGGSGGRGGGSGGASGDSSGGSEGVLEFRREAVMLPIDVGACSSAGWEPGRRGVLGAEGMQVRKENQVRLGGRVTRGGDGASWEAGGATVRIGRLGEGRCELGGGGGVGETLTVAEASGGGAVERRECTFFWCACLERGTGSEETCSCPRVKVPRCAVLHCGAS